MDIFTQNTFRKGIGKAIRLVNNSLNHPPQYANYNAERPLGKGKAACYAPMSSMYIASNGDVRACCMNIDQVFGNLKHESLLEIWNSDKRQALIQASKAYKLPAGCNNCIKHFETGNSSNSTAILYDQYRKEHKWAQRIDFELSLACNLDCRMCMFSSHQNEGSKAKASYHFDQSFFDELKPFLKHLKHAGFYGGEPFIIEAYYQIWEDILTLNPKAYITVQSNGSVLNERILNFLKRGRFQINFSIDSLDKTRFEYIRDKAGFEQVIENFEIINQISQKRKLTQSIAVCPMKQNLDEMGDLLDFANKHKSLIYFNQVDTKGFSVSEMDEGELQKIVETLKSKYISKKSEIEVINAQRFAALIRAIESQLIEIKFIQKKSERKIEFSPTSFLEILKKKMQDNLSETIASELNELIKDLPQTFEISALQLEELENLPSEMLNSYLTTHSKEHIKQAIFDFIRE